MLALAPSGNSGLELLSGGGAGGSPTPSYQAPPAYHHLSSTSNAAQAHLLNPPPPLPGSSGPSSLAHHGFAVSSSSGPSHSANSGQQPLPGILGPDGERFLWVMDPMTRKLKVPLSVIEPTQATTMVGTVPSLCMLFLDGRCRHPACRQIHIPIAILHQLRKEAQQAPSCCGLHGDSRDGTLLTDRFSFVSIVSNPAPAAAAPSTANGLSPVGSSGISSSAQKLLSNSPTPGPMADGLTNASLSQSFSGSHAPGPTALLTLSSDRIAMTVGLQRYLAQGRMGSMHVAPPLGSVTPPPPPPFGAAGMGGGASFASTPNGGSFAGTYQPMPRSQQQQHQQGDQSSPNTSTEKVEVEAAKSHSISEGAGMSNTKPANGTALHPSSSATANSSGVAPVTPPLNAANGHHAGASLAHGGNTLEIPLRMVCRLHLSRKCRFLEDCNNVHICREYDGKLPAAPAGSGQGPQHCSEVLQSLRSSGHTVSVGSIVYNVTQLAPGAVTDTEMHQLITLHKQTFPHLQLRIVDVRCSTESPHVASAAQGQGPTGVSPLQGSAAPRYPGPASTANSSPPKVAGKSPLMSGRPANVLPPPQIPHGLANGVSAAPPSGQSPVLGSAPGQGAHGPPPAYNNSNTGFGGGQQPQGMLPPPAFPGSDAPAPPLPTAASFPPLPSSSGNGKDALNGSTNGVGGPQGGVTRSALPPPAYSKLIPTPSQAPPRR